MNESERDATLARLDERTRHIEREVCNMHKKFRDYVTNNTFRPVQLLVYTFVGIICASVIGSLVALVVR